MYRLGVKCIKCNRTWDKECVIPWGPDDWSGSLCDPCFLEVISPTIHRRQLREGNVPCFGKGELDCEQVECRYRRWCVCPEEKASENKKAA
jgi:hypothetical protein